MFKHAPITWSLSLIAVGLHLVTMANPSLLTALELRTQGPQLWEGWRWLTGHFVHFNHSHFIWDLAVFLPLGCIVEKRTSQGFGRFIVSSALAITGAVILFLPDLGSYRGLSGLDSALFIALAIQELRNSKNRAQSISILWGIALVGFSMKILFEIMTGHAMFAGDLGPGVITVPLAHLVGAAVALAWFTQPRKAPIPLSPLSTKSFQGHARSTD